MAALGDPRQSPDDYKRKRSGVWRHDYDHATGIERWTCDVKKLREQVGQAMCNRTFAEMVHQNGIDHILDSQYGAGTAKAFHTKLKGEDRLVSMQFDRFAQDLARGKDSMASLYGSQWLTGTTSTNTCTTTTATDSSMYYIRDEIKRQQQRMVTDHLYGQKVKSPPKPLNLGHRIKPFNPAKGVRLLTQLQADFDSLCRTQMELVRG